MPVPGQQKVGSLTMLVLHICTFCSKLTYKLKTDIPAGIIEKAGKLASLHDYLLTAF